MKKTAFLLFVLAVYSSSAQISAQMSKPTIFVEAQQGFETYLAAAFTKQNVPVDLVTDEARAKYVLKSIKLEMPSTVKEGKTAREVQPAANVSVQLIETDSTKILWAYSVSNRKESKSQQSMAESIARHFKDFARSSDLYGLRPSKQRSFNRGIY